MGLLDKAKEQFGANKDKAQDLVQDHAPKIKDGVDKVADVVDDKTGQQHTDKIEGAADKVKDGIDKIAGDGAA
jgi:hypothetical protein